MTEHSAPCLAQSEHLVWHDKLGDIPGVQRLDKLTLTQLQVVLECPHPGHDVVRIVGRVFSTRETPKEEELPDVF